MSTSPELEDRLRTGLRGAADAIPPASATSAGTPEARLHRLGAGRGWLRTSVATAAALAAVLGAMVATGRYAGDRDSSASSASSTAGGAPDQVRQTNGKIPGQAIVSDSSLRTYGPDGQQTGSVDLTPLRNVQAASSDLDGGWVACGLVDEAVAPGETSSGFPDRLMWYPADGNPVQIEIDGQTPVCTSNSFRVVDSTDGPLLVYVDQPLGAQDFQLSGLVLASGEKRELLHVAGQVAPDGWSATSARVLVQSQEAGLQLFDLSTGDELPLPAIDLASASELELAPDATTAAVLAGDVDGPIELVVYDLTTGAERFRKSFDIPAEGDEMSYDGTIVAIGSYYGDQGPVTVIDLATGAERTIDDHGALL